MATTLAGNVIVEDGAVLLLHRRDEEHWELPGGKVMDGETPRNAAIREAEEELGCTVMIRSSCGRLDLDFEHDGEPYSIRAFLADIVDGQPAPSEDRFDDMAWMDADDLLQADLAPNLAATLDELRLLLIRNDR